ncbi:hypothetical protein ACHAXR_008170 [Thalassiosira sp. AJA248-18]
MGKSFLYRIPFIIPAVLFGLQVLISELIAGWTKKYTSGPLGWNSNIPDMKGKVVIVTGANTGIGYQSALKLANAGAHTIVAARSEKKGLEAVKKIKQELKSAGSEANNVQYLPLDLASFNSIEQFADQFHALETDLHLLVLNAGVMKSPGVQFIGQELSYGFDTTEEGFEYHIGVNHIGHAYLTKLLLKDLTITASNNDDGYGARIVSVSSMAESGAPETGMRFADWNPAYATVPAGYEDGVFYGQSKLANLMWASEMSHQLNRTGVSVYSCHPGVIRSDLTRYMEQEMNSQTAGQGEVAKFVSKILASFFDSIIMGVETGALTQLHVATAAKDTLVNGGHYHPIGRHVTPAHPQARNDTLREKLWMETERAIQLRSNYTF